MNHRALGQRTHSRRRKTCWWVLGGLLGVIAIAVVAFRVSAWPGAMVIRTAFNYEGTKTRKAMEKHKPSSPVTTIADQRYQPKNHDATLDVYFPERVKGTKERLPVIVWAHGGAWLAGNKGQAAPYYKLLAAEGYTVIAMNYALAPNHTYPTAVHQLNDVYAYMQANAERFHLDPERVVLAGDSAGSQMSGQMAALITNPAYAAEVGVVPTLKPKQLSGVILFCGIFEMQGLTQTDPNLPKIVGWGADVTVWAFAGTRNFDDPVIRQMSPYFHVTKDFPTSFISGGNGDALTNVQSKPLAEKLESLGVDVTTRFFPKDHQPSLPHEYQFNLDNADGQNALKATIEFLQAHTQPRR